MRCEHCGNEFEGTTDTPCPRCGHPSRPAAPPAGQGSPYDATAPPAGGLASGAPPPPSPPLAPDGPPWERQRSLASLLETLRDVLLEPTRTFAEASPDAGFGWSLVYWLILTGIGVVFAAFWIIVQGFVGLDVVSILENAFGTLPGDLEPLREMLAPAGVLVTLIGIPFQLGISLVGLFVWGAIVHLLLMLFGGANRGFEATFRAVAYASGSTALLQVVPFCGQLVGLVWSLVIQIIAVKELHRASGGQAAGAVLTPVVLCCVCGVAGSFLLAVLVGGLAAGG